MAFLRCDKTFKFSAVLFFLIVGYSIQHAQAVENPLSVVIIGAGPAGLATAIEACLTGADVTLVEKREAYTRQQLLFLFASSLELLDKWKVVIPPMTIAYNSSMHNLSQQKIGTTTVKALEEALFERLAHSNAKMIRGEFKNLENNRVSIVTETGQLILPYDIIIGADGAHSRVRELLAISNTVFGKALARAALVSLSYAPQEVKIPDAYLKQSFFIKRIMMPKGSVVIAQYPLSVPEEIQKPFELEKLEELAYSAGWVEESELINKGVLVDTGLITVSLQQANSFVNISNAAVLVGDAAALAPFCQARGANTALKSAVLVAKLIIELAQEGEIAYQNFNDRMKEATDELINDSFYLLDNTQLNAL
jgi:2-polyprenyl-6-methoxyphenol hydroxylase-like FAD-dependent oxidoreductase